MAKEVSTPQSSEQPAPQTDSQPQATEKQPETTQAPVTPNQPTEKQEPQPQTAEKQPEMPQASVTLSQPTEKPEPQTASPQPQATQTTVTTPSPETPKPSVTEKKELAQTNNVTKNNDTDKEINQLVIRLKKLERRLLLGRIESMFFLAAIAAIGYMTFENSKQNASEHVLIGNHTPIVNNIEKPNNNEQINTIEQQLNEKIDALRSDLSATEEKALQAITSSQEALNQLNALPNSNQEAPISQIEESPVTVDGDLADDIKEPEQNIAVETLEPSNNTNEEIQPPVEQVKELDDSPAEQEPEAPTQSTDQ